MRNIIKAHRVRRQAIALGIVAAAGLVQAAPSWALDCTFDPATHAVTLDLHSAGYKDATLTRVGDQIGWLEFTTRRSGLCGASVHEADVIRVLGGNENDSITIDESNGRFAPGYTHENRSRSEIEIRVRLGGQSGDRAALVGTPGDDLVTIGQKGLALNGDMDVDVSLVDPVGTIAVEGGAGNDVISAAGGAGTGAVATARVTLGGGDGNDAVTGGAGNDILNGDAGDDQVAGGAGDDALYGGDGNDAIDGGAGRDHLIGGAGDDLLSAVDGEVDTLSGGSGQDSASADPADVVDSTVETRT